MTFFALEHFSVDYELDPVVRALPAGANGIRLSAIRDVLQGCGLSTHARKDVALGDISKLVNQGCLAILPIRLSNPKTGEWGHYVVAGWAENGKEFRGIDVLGVSGPFDSFLNSEMFDGFGRTVLLVGPPADDSPRPLRVAPNTVDFGKVRIDGPQSLIEPRLPVVLKNEGERPILLSRAESACGCVRCDYPGGLIDPGQSTEVQVVLMPEIVQVGPQRREVAIRPVGQDPILIEVLVEGFQRSKPEVDRDTSRSIVASPLQKACPNGCLLHLREDDLDLADRVSVDWSAFDRTQVESPASNEPQPLARYRRCSEATSPVIGVLSDQSTIDALLEQRNVVLRVPLQEAVSRFVNVRVRLRPPLTIQNPVRTLTSPQSSLVIVLEGSAERVRELRVVKTVPDGLCELQAIPRATEEFEVLASTEGSGLFWADIPLRYDRLGNSSVGLVKLAASLDGSEVVVPLRILLKK